MLGSGRLVSGLRVPRPAVAGAGARSNRGRQVSRPRPRGSVLGQAGAALSRVRWWPFAATLGDGALALGVLTLLGGATTLLYVLWREAAARGPARQGPQEDLPAQWTGATADGADRGLRLAAAKTLGESAEWMRIPHIGVNSPVMEMGLQGGEYQVPSFDVGHHVDSANPGQPGNSVYNGHLETINAGHIFARLHGSRRATWCTCIPRVSVRLGHGRYVSCSQRQPQFPAAHAGA